MIQDAVRRLLTQREVDEDALTREEKIALALIKRAEMGTADAIKLIDAMAPPVDNEIVVKVVE